LSVGRGESERERERDTDVRAAEGRGSTGDRSGTSHV
jgi:hypothetical protein